MQLAQLLSWIVAWGCLSSPSLAQCQTAKLVASNSGPQHQFGFAVAISGDWLTVGAPFESDIEKNSGAAYMFERQGAEWIEVQKLKATPTSFAQILGSSVSIDGDVMAAGAPGDSQTHAAAGAVYVFERQGRQWIQTARISANDGSPSSQRQFGTSVSVFGDRIIVGAIGDDVPVDSGAAYVFVRQSGAWIQEAKLKASDPESWDQFGYSVSLHGNRALIGAPWNDGVGGTSSGAAYVFERGHAGWVQKQKLTANDAWYNDIFGMSVSLNSTRALVGSYNHNHTPSQRGGSAYLFELQQGLWSQTQELLGSDSLFNDSFGIAVALAGDLALIGAEGHDDLGAGSGAAYAFKRIGSNWTQISKLLATEGTQYDGFGWSLSLSGSTVVSGLPHDNPGCSDECFSGSACVLELAPDAVQYCSCSSDAPCGNTDSYGGCINSTGFGAVLAASGSSSVASDELLLRVDHLRPFGTGLMFMGGGGGAVPFANGIRCVSPGTSGLYRFGAQTISEDGTLVQGPGLVTHSQNFPAQGLITAGSTWYFQCWYRDALGPCGGTSNFSNALAVAFQL